MNLARLESGRDGIANEQRRRLPDISANGHDEIPPIGTEPEPVNSSEEVDLAYLPGYPRLLGCPWHDTTYMLGLDGERYWLPRLWIDRSPPHSPGYDEMLLAATDRSES